MSKSGKVKFCAVQACQLAAQLVAWQPGSAAPADRPSGQAAATGAPAANAAGVRRIDWDALLPSFERAGFDSSPPPARHDYLGELGQRAEQSGSLDTNPDIEGMTVRLPGFVVPLTMDPDGAVSELFLVPYFGACIHVPPPPPNQIVYVRLKVGLHLKSITDSYWMIGTLHVREKSARMGLSEYSMDGAEAQPYDY